MASLGTRRAVRLVFALATALFASGGARADDDDYDDVDEPGWYEGTTTQTEAARESWTGAEGLRQVWSLYSGVTWAPFTNLRQDGWRLRMVAARSAFSYVGPRYDAAVGDTRPVLFRGAGRTVDLAAGYQWSSGALTAKLFAGIRFHDQVIGPFDPEAMVQGRATGATGAMELWYNVSDRHWAALDLTAASPFRSYAHRLRLGQRLGPSWSVGGEARMFGHIEARTAQLGAFVRFDNGVHEVSASAGWSAPDAGDTGVYGTIQWLRRF